MSFGFTILLVKWLKNGCCIVKMETRLYIYIVRVTLKRDCESGSDSDHGVDIDGDNVSTSHSHIDSDGHSRFDNVMVCLLYTSPSPRD